MQNFTIQLAFAEYHTRTQTVEGASLIDALQKAINASYDADDWVSSEITSSVFVEAAAEGKDVDLWSESTRQLDIPASLTERGEGSYAIVTLSGGMVRNVETQNGPIRIEIRDYDIGQADTESPYIQTDERGKHYIASEWSNVIPTPEAAE